MFDNKFVHWGKEINWISNQAELNLGMERITYDINHTRVVIKGNKVICKDKILKEKIEVILKTSPSYGPEKGFHHYLSEVFGENITLVSGPDEDEKSLIIY